MSELVPVLMTRERWFEIVRITISGALIFLYWKVLVPLPVLWGAVAFGLYPLLKTGILDFIHERKIGTEIFVTIATLIALFGGEAIAGAVLMVIILIAEFIAELNTDKARASIKSMIGSVPQYALLRKDGQEISIPIRELKINDVILVRAGEKIPVDGQVVGGTASINEAPITGESVPKDKEKGSEVFAGTVIQSGAIDVKTTKIGGDTLFGRIIALVEEAEEHEAPIQKLADKIAAWLIPAVFVFLFLVFITTHNVRMLVTLMIFTSPAELGLATPMVMIAAISRAARNGILVKGGIFLESLAKVNVIVFDKTGTLTTGKPEVSRVVVYDKTITEQELLGLAGAANRRSGHPLAKAMMDYISKKRINLLEPMDFHALPGRGVQASVDGRKVLVGNKSLLSENNVSVPSGLDENGETVVYVAVNQKLAGLLHIADRIRPGAKEAVAKLKATGIKRVVMLTGDNTATAARIASELAIDEVKAELLPEDKVRAIIDLQNQGYKVAMVGDGINDAPALAIADVGIAMGGGGTQAALEAADVALMRDDLSKIVAAREIARCAYRTIQENLLLGVGVVHVLGIIAALLQIIGPIQAAIIHLGPDVLVFLNSVKLLRVRIESVDA